MTCSRCGCARTASPLGPNHGWCKVIAAQTSSMPMTARHPDASRTSRSVVRFDAAYPGDPDVRAICNQDLETAQLDPWQRCRSCRCVAHPARWQYPQPWTARHTFSLIPLAHARGGPPVALRGTPRPSQRASAAQRKSCRIYFVLPSRGHYPECGYTHPIWRFEPRPGRAPFHSVRTVGDLRSSSYRGVRGGPTRRHAIDESS